VRARRGLATAALALAFASGAYAEPATGPSRYQARVVHVRDGDSLIVSDGARQRELRLAEIDAPERGQAWGKRATRALAALVNDRALRVELVELDRYGREVSRVLAGDVCVACALVREGHAWAFRRYLRDPAFLDWEREARAARRGLWSLPAHTFVPPWEWRDGVRVAEADEAALRSLLGAAPERAGARAACGAKRYCREMSSCAEARFYLAECGALRLDGDGDGTPCDELCR
jgi:endonuclease YncB( thermonuclease family)